MNRSSFIKSLIGLPFVAPLLGEAAVIKHKTHYGIMVQGFRGKFRTGDIIKIASQPNKRFKVTEINGNQVAVCEDKGVPNIVFI